MSARVILVTGANGGLGQAIAEAFVSELPTNFVWLGVRARRAQAEGFVEKHPNQSRCLELDVIEPAAWTTALRAVLECHQRLDVLVNNAGHHHDGLLGTMAPAAWQQVVATNLDSVFHGCQAVLPAMINQRHGRIINIASLSALLAPAGQSNYAAAKAGVLALTQSLAKEVARIGITVNALCPGYIDTDAVRGMSPEAQKAAQHNIPMRRFGRPEEVAAAVRFLACAEAAYITGSVLKIDGGLL